MSVRRPRTTARTALAALAGVLALTLGACADGPEPKFADPTKSATPSPSEPAEVTEETPEEFIQRWAQAMEKMQNTGQTTEYEALTERCETCRDLTNNVTTYYTAGGFIEWEGMAIERTRKVAPLVYEVWGRSGATRYKASSDAQVKRLDGGRVKYQVTLEEDGGVFLVKEVVGRPV